MNVVYLSSFTTASNPRNDGVSVFRVTYSTGSSGTLMVMKMETQSSRWEPCSASPQHEVEQSRGPGHGQGRRGW